MPIGSLPRLSVELGLTAVVATQLWHHLFIDPELSELPAWTGNRTVLENASF
jgi:asparagine synthase (glutamine-hydrolysing)